LDYGCGEGSLNCLTEKGKISMASGLSWIDFAEEDRHKMLNIIQLFKEQGTLDELGVGVIRDAFADYFFPGTSTIQTRARYMLFVPWIYLDLERRKTPSADVARKLRNGEIKLIFALLKSEDDDGIIGKVSKEQLVRFPSSIYWNGLGAWGIKLFPGTQEEYHKGFSHYFRQKEQRDLEESEANDSEGMLHNWHRGLPSPPNDYLDHAELRLTKEEAVYLQERILQKQGNTLLAILVREPDYIQTDFLWNHPIVTSLPPLLTKEILHAHNFSDSIYGAALMYNLMLSELNNLDESIETYRSEIEEWAEGLSSRWCELFQWHEKLNEFWSCLSLKQAKITPRTHGFIGDWLQLIFKEIPPRAISGSEITRHMIHDREVEIKRKRARLENPSARAQWNGASGAYRLSYRWGNANRMLKDVLIGLRRRDG
jgi:hypothetical protein